MLSARQGLLNPAGAAFAQSAPAGGAIESGGQDSFHVDPGAFICTKMPVLRLVFLGLVGLAEVLVLGILVDTDELLARSSWWAPWVRHAPQCLQILIAACAAWMFLGWGTSRSVLEGQASSMARSSLFGWFIVHLGCYAAFAWLSWVVLALAPSTSGHVSHEVWLAAWVIVGTATLGTFAASACPFAVWKSLLVRSRWAVLVASATGVAAWLVGGLASQGWKPLAGGTFTLVRVLLSCVYDDVVIDQSRFIVGTARFAVRIAPQCSGYEGLGLISVFLLVFSWAFRHRLRFPQAVLLFPAGLASIWLLNAARIAGLVAIGTSWSSEVALGGFHSQAGWLVFNFVALGLVIVGTRLEFFARNPRAAVTVEPHETNETASYVAPFLTAIAVGMVTGALSTNTGMASFGAHVLRIGAAVGTLLLLRRGLRDLNWSFSWPSVVLGAAAYGMWIVLLGADASAGRPTMFDAELSAMLVAACVAIRLVGYILVTPIVEELAFRGFVLRRVVSADFQHAELQPFPWVGVAVSSVLFGAFHGSNWLSGIIAGLAYAIAFARTGRLGDSIAAHATTNGLLAAHAMLTGNWAAWT